MGVVDQDVIRLRALAHPAQGTQICYSTDNDSLRTLSNELAALSQSALVS